MYFLLIGIVALAMKYLEVEPVAAWSWWIVLSPFGLAAIWWWYADASGYTKKKEVEKMEKRKHDRIEKSREAMGMLSAKNKSKKK